MFPSTEGTDCGSSDLFIYQTEVGTSVIKAECTSKYRRWPVSPEKFMKKYLKENKTFFVKIDFMNL